MRPAEFMERLEGLKFETNPAILDKAERDFRASMTKYKGHEALAVAFTRFFIETTYQFNRRTIPAHVRPVSAQHSLLVEKLVRASSTLRAARVTGHSGYPLQGFTLLRNIYDDCVLASAALQGLTDFEKLHGVEPGVPFDSVRSRKYRIAVEREVRAKMDGKESGLPASVLEALKLLDDMYDTETHGGRLTTAINVSWLRGKPLAVVPDFKEDGAMLFMNRWQETAWLTHRLLPCVQLTDAPLPEAWAKNWLVIDDSFRVVMMSLFTSLDKPYFKAVCDFVDAKFPFDANSRFSM